MHGLISTIRVLALALVALLPISVMDAFPDPPAVLRCCAAHDCRVADHVPSVQLLSRPVEQSRDAQAFRRPSWESFRHFDTKVRGQAASDSSPPQA